MIGAIDRRQRTVIAPRMVENRMIRFCNATSQMKYCLSNDMDYTVIYDAFGQRIRKYESSQYRYYITSGANVLEEYNHSQVLNAAHIYNGTSRLATIISGDDIYYVCADKIQSSKVLVDEIGNKDQTRDYYPYGNTSTSTGSVSAY